MNLRDQVTPCFGKTALFDSTDKAAHQEAIELCATCPVRTQCAALLEEVLAKYASYGGPQGTWAGQGFGIGRKPGRPPLTQKRRSKSVIPDCGTESAYARHRNRKEDCLTCRAAHADFMRDKRRQEREAKWALQGKTA